MPPPGSRFEVRFVAFEDRVGHSAFLVLPEKD